MTEVLDEHEMTDEEYKAWLAHYNWGTNIRLRLGAPPVEIPIRVYKYWEQHGMKTIDDGQTDDDTVH